MEKLEEEEDALLRPVLEQLSDGGAAITARLHDVRRRRRLLVQQHQQQYPGVAQKREEEGALQLGPTAVELPPELWLRVLDYVEPRERVRSAALVCRQWSSLVVASIRHGALGERDFASVASRAERRLAFYAERCGSLVSLDLSYWRTVRASLREHLIEYLPQCAALQSLSLRSATALVHKLLPVAPVSLRSLDLTNTRAGDRALKHVCSRLTNLTTLSVADTHVTDRGLAGLSVLSSLRKLNLWGNEVEGTCFRQLPPGLESIRLCDEIKPEYLSHLPASVRSVKGYVFNDHHLCSLPPGLRRLSIFHSPGISPDALPATLTRLDISPFSAKELAWLPSSLLQLDVGRCSFAGFTDPVHMPPRLEVLNIVLVGATDQHVGSLCAALPRLRTLTLSWDRMDCTRGLHHLTMLTSLRTLRLLGHTADGSFLATLPPSLSRLDLRTPLDASWLHALPPGLLCYYVDNDGKRTPVHTDRPTGAAPQHDTHDVEATSPRPHRGKRRRLDEST